MLQILGFRAPGKANLPGTLGRHCLDLVPTFHAGFFEIDSCSLLELFWERATFWESDPRKLLQVTISLSNRQRARPLRTCPHKRVTLIMVGFSRPEAIKSKNFEERGAHFNTASWGKGKRNCKHSPWVRFWVGPHWVGPCSLVDSCSNM